jgi:uncharacterized protein (DUF983 family)
MFHKGSKLYGIWGWKCPRCQEGDLYKTGIGGGVYNMHKKCTKCTQDFEMEPGFYWGAMYIGYALSAGYMLAGFAICLWLFKLSATASFALLIFIGILLLPFLARYSRAIWLSSNVRFSPKIAKWVKEQADN